jgi:hypothetical protein
LGCRIDFEARARIVRLTAGPVLAAGARFLHNDRDVRACAKLEASATGWNNRRDRSTR